MEEHIEFPGRKGTYILPRKSHRFFDKSKLGRFEVIRPISVKPTKAVVDVDGTLSHERDLWMDWEFEIFTQACRESGIAVEMPELKKAALDIFERTMGFISASQFYEIAGYITRKGGATINPLEYYQKYRQSMQGKVEERRSQYGYLGLQVAGGRQLLEKLNKKFHGEVYIASGTDRDGVIDSLRFLQLDKCISLDNVVGASLQNPDQCAKAQLARELDGKGDLLWVGDSPLDVYYGWLHGVALGRCAANTSEIGRQYFTEKKMRRLLINGGANIITENFVNYANLIDIATSQGHARGY